MALSIGHQGSWFGLPDFGITEAIAGLSGNTNRSSQLGSNLVGNNNYAQQNNQSTGLSGAPTGVSFGTPIPSNQWNYNNTNGSVQGLSTASSIPKQSNSLIDLTNKDATDQTNKINSGYGYNEAVYNQQLSDAESAYNRSTQDAGNLLSGLTSQVDQQKTSAASLRDKSIDQAGQTAQSTQRSIRNSLRALGLLNSSAGAEMLSKPLTEFDKVRSGYVENYNNTISQLDDYLRQKTAENSAYLNSLRDNYTSTVNRIKTDLRFNEQERNNALQSLNTALAAKVSEIRQSQQDAINYTNALGSQALQEVNTLTGGYNTSIAGIQPTIQNQSTSNASIYEDPRRKQLLSQQ